MAGQDTAEWIVMDFVDVVVHLFDEEHRRYYDLELLWGEAPKVRWQPRATKKKAEETEETDEKK
jgi:ribosome-associated protein